jgi:hypothetical protein
MRQKAEETMNDELIFYSTDDGQAIVQLRGMDGTLWLTQNEIAELFATSKSNISIHVKNILSEGELEESSTVKESLTVRSEGNRQVKRRTALFSLQMVLAIGYRVRSPRGTQFRQWATQHLAEYLVKGFVMDDERLKNPGGWDYFDELLARIREIRASEKRFYQKVRDLFALSSDYQPADGIANQFFAEVQNKLLYAVTQHSAAEIVVSRADPDSPNMALMTWSGSRVRKADVLVAKNYLTADEVDTLNRLVVIFLDQAELRVKEGKALTLSFWRENVDRMLAFNDRPILKDAGTVSHDEMRTIVSERYEVFDQRRREAEALAADREDIKTLEVIEERVRQNKK